MHIATSCGPWPLWQPRLALDQHVGLATCLGLLAVALPAVGTAEFLVGDLPSAQMAPVVLGVWVLKGALLLLALLVLALRTVSLPVRASRPLVDVKFGAGERATASEVVLLVLLLTLATLLRAHALGDGLWFDEIQTLAESVRRPFGHLVATISNTNHHPLFSLLAKLSVESLGETAWALRLPAALLGVASLGALYWFGTVVTTRLEALLATLLLTVSYHHLWFSQNARGYTALLFCTLVASGLFLRMISRNTAASWRDPVLYAAVMALATYTHPMAAIVGMTHAAIWLALAIRHRRAEVWPTAWVPLGAVLLSGLLTVLLYAPMLPQMVSVVMQPPMEGVQTEWKSPLWMATEALRSLSRGSALALAVLGAGAIGGLIGISSFGRRHWTVAATLVLPLVLTAVLIIATKRNLWPRFFFFGAGFAVLIGIRGIFAFAAGLRSRHVETLAFAATMVVVLASAATIPRSFGPKQDYHAAWQVVERVRTPQDAVLAVDMTGAAYCWLSHTPCDTVGSLEQLRTAEAGQGRTWLLYQFPIRLQHVQPAMWQHLNERYRVAAAIPGTLGGGTIYLAVGP